MKYYDWLSKNYNGVIKGYFGAGKTFTTTKFIAEDVSSGYVYGVPLRRLRDWIADKLIPNAYILKSHEEYCNFYDPNLGEPYLIQLAKHVKEWRTGKIECKYYSQLHAIIELIKAGAPIKVVTTHIHVPIFQLYAMAYKMNMRIFYDEGEDALLRFIKPLPQDLVEVIKYIDKDYYEKLKSFRFKYGNAYYEIVNRLHNYFFRTFIMSATIPSIYYDIYDINQKPFKLYTIPTTVNDTIIVLNQKLYASTKKSWFNLAMDVVEYVYGKSYDPIGIVSRSYSMTLEICSYLRARKYPIACDTDPDFLKNVSKVDIAVLTTNGRYYRGVSLFSKRGKDFPIIIAFFQRQVGAETHPYLDVLFTSNNDIYLEYLRHLLYARNLQAIHRFNRYRTERHIMILLDIDFFNAFNELEPEYLDQIKVKKVNTFHGIKNTFYTTYKNLG